jgi:hypothetical protein
MHEHVLAAIVANDEAEALLSVEELYDAGAFTDDLGGHAAATATEPAAAAAAETTAAAAEAATTAAAISTAAAAVTTTAAAAEAITAAKAAATEATAAEISAAAAKFVTAEIVALVTAATTTIATATFIETHALFVFPVRPVSHSRAKASDDGRRPSGANQQRLIASLSRKSATSRTKSSAFLPLSSRYLRQRGRDGTAVPHVDH